MYFNYNYGPFFTYWPKIMFDFDINLNACHRGVINLTFMRLLVPNLTYARL